MSDPSAPNHPGRRAEPNRLAHETSPYLLQHAWNPVDWHPWDDEALAEAKRRDRPIFLSIGYSACHWCHVMERESFEDPHIAGTMNRLYVNIKVDREERPDLDRIYMTAVTALTGHGGWPMSVFLTPDLQPFYGGTYWPPHARQGMPGFEDVLLRVADAWDRRRPDVLRGAAELTDVVAVRNRPEPGSAALDETLVAQSGRVLVRAADRQHGGFGRAPKFPHPMDLRVLLRAARRCGTPEALDVVRETLDRMDRGGIHDQLGGGFHRYSTDARWLVPHFEKMLYDNSLLVSTYLEAYQATGIARFAAVVRDVLDYLLREMTDAQGAFHATQDADSEGEEGRFFVWTRREIGDLLPRADADLFCRCYDIDEEGNWEGHTILHRPRPHERDAELLGIAPQELESVLARCREILFAARERRIRPARDEKILVSWNGLALSAFALAAQVLDEPRYAQAAVRAATFLLESVRGPDGSLQHVWKDGRARFDACLDDYACLVDGLVDLAQATSDMRWIDAALGLADAMTARFADPDGGGFFDTAADAAHLIARTKDTHDNATPSGNGMAAYALLRLGRLTGRADLEQRAGGTLAMLSGELARVTMAGGQALLALDFLLGPASEIVVVEGTDAAQADRLQRAVHAGFVPNKSTWRIAGAGTAAHDTGPLRELLAGKSSPDGRAVAYVCRLGTCGPPLFEPGDVTAALA